MTKEMKILDLFIEKGGELADFYAIRITKKAVHLQGSAEQRKIRLYESMDFAFEYDKENNWLEGSQIVENQRSVGEAMSETKITITLTLP